MERQTIVELAEMVLFEIGFRGGESCIYGFSPIN